MDVYICYSRKDGALVRNLSFSMGQEGLSFWVDAEDLPRGSDYWKDIRNAIVESNLFLFVLTENALLSPFLHMELDFARQNNKQIVTVSVGQRESIRELIARIEEAARTEYDQGRLNTSRYSHLDDIPLDTIISNFHYLSEVPNYTLSLRNSQFEEQVGDLDRFIREHQERAREHTRWLTQALNWNENARNPDLLLRGQELREAVTWLYSPNDSKVKPTPIHIAFITASHRRNGKTAIKRWLSRLGILRDDRVFISYRRDDSQEISSAIYDVLVKSYGKRTTFFDIDSIPAGVDFAEYVSGTLNRCSVFLAIIGDKWIDIQNKEGVRRLDDPKDWVRLEVATALKNPDITVIPVLIGSTNMPSSADLPEPMRELPYRNARRVRDDHLFSNDMDKLMEAIDEARRG
jgi:hypothetical protein